MTDIKPRHPQTKVKHIILEKYLAAWGGIIVNGFRRRPTDLHLVYIDCNASNGRFDGELEDVLAKRATQAIFGSPIIGVRALDSLTVWARNSAGINLHTNSILIEREPKIFSELKQSLKMAGLTQRMKETDTFTTLQNGQIAILCEDSTSIASKLVNYTQSGYKFSFFLLDPYGPTGIPLSFVGEIIRQQRHDVIINMPYQDLHKKSGIVTKSNLTPAESEIVKNYDAMFGHGAWRNIAKELDPDAIWNENETDEARDLEQELMNCYRESLQSVDQDLTVKSIRLRFPDRERTMYYLYLTTHDPNGALEMNKVLWDAWQQEHELRWEYMESKKRGSQLPLFELAAPPLEVPGRASTEEIAKYILSLLAGKTLTRKGIYKALANELYFATEIDSALRSLRKQKQAFFDNPLENKTPIKIGGN